MRCIIERMQGATLWLQRQGPVAREYDAWHTTCGIAGVHVTPSLVSWPAGEVVCVELQGTPTRTLRVGDVVYWRPLQGCRVYLDDERTPPPGWLLVRWPDEVIALLEEGGVSALSLDHDLGDDARGTGYDVILWLEEAVAMRRLMPPSLKVHSANVAGRKKMELGIESIERWAGR